MFFIKVFDEFMESEYYSDFATNLYEDIFIILRNKGHVDNSFNWNSCQILFDLFFRSFIRSKIADNQIFYNLKNNYTNVYEMILRTGTGDPLYQTSINFETERIKSLYGNLVTSHFDKIHYFIESIYLSSLTYSINSDMLSYFLK